MPIETETTLAQLQNELRRDPRHAQVTLKAKAREEGSDQSPPQELGPVQQALDALAESLAASYRRFADALDIPLNNVEIRIEGLDLNGLAASADGVRPGPGSLRAEARLSSPADIYALERLRITVERHDPVLDLLKNATPMRLELSINIRDNNSLAA